MQTVALFLLFSAGIKPHYSVPFAYKAPDAQSWKLQRRTWMRKSLKTSKWLNSGIKDHLLQLIYHRGAERETRAELAMQIQAKDQLKYKGKDMLCDSNNKFDSGSVPHGDYGHLCNSLNDIHRYTFFIQFQQ